MLLLHFKRLFSPRGLCYYYALNLALFLLLTTIFNNYSEVLTQENKIVLGLVSQDNHQLSQVLLDSFSNNPQFSSLFSLSISDLKTTEAAFKNGDLDAYVVIPEGFTEGLLAYNSQGIDLFGHLENPLKNQLIAAIMGGYAHYIDASNAATWSLYFTMKDAGLYGDQITKINTAFSFEMIGTTLGRNNYFELIPYAELPLLSAKAYFALALPLGLIALSTIGVGTQAIGHRQQALYKRQLVAGLPYWRQVLVAQVAHWLNGLLLLLPLFLVLVWQYPLTWPRGVFVLALAWWLWQGLWRFASCFTKDANAFVMATSALGFFSVLSSGGFVPYLMLPDWLKQLGSAMPGTLFMQMATGTMGIWEIGLYTALMLVGSLGLIGLEVGTL